MCEFCSDVSGCVGCVLDGCGSFFVSLPNSTPRTENAANVWRSGGVGRKEISLQGASAKKVVVKRAAPVIPSVSPDILPQPKLTQKAPFAYTGLPESVKSTISRRRSSIREAGTVGTAGVQKTALVNSTKAISKPVVATNIPVNPQRWSVHGTYSSRFAAAKAKFGSQTSRYAIPLRQESKSGYAIATTKVVSTPSINQAQVTTFVQKLNQSGSSGFGTKGKVGLLIRQFEDNSFSSPRPRGTYCLIIQTSAKSANLFL